MSTPIFPNRLRLFPALAPLFFGVFPHSTHGAITYIEQTRTLYANAAGGMNFQEQAYAAPDFGILARSVEASASGSGGSKGSSGSGRATQSQMSILNPQALTCVQTGSHGAGGINAVGAASSNGVLDITFMISVPTPVRVAARFDVYSCCVQSYGSFLVQLSDTISQSVLQEFSLVVPQAFFDVDLPYENDLLLVPGQYRFRVTTNSSASGGFQASGGSGNYQVTSSLTIIPSPSSALCMVAATIGGHATRRRRSREGLAVPIVIQAWSSRGASR